MIKSDVKSAPPPLQHMCQWFCKPSSIVLSFVVLSLYMLLIVWAYDHITKPSQLSPSSSQTIMQTTNEENIPAGDDTSTISGAKTGNSTPNKVIIKQYACDPSGICNVYADPKGQSECPVVFSDSRCLSQCQDISKRCKE